MIDEENMKHADFIQEIKKICILIKVLLKISVVKLKKNYIKF